LSLRGPFAINSLCIRRAIFDRIGSFDTAFRFAADREWMLRAWLAGVGIAEVAQPVYRYLSHMGSSTLDRDKRNYALMRWEHLMIVRRFLSPSSLEGQPAEVTRALRRWHAAETAMLALHHARSGKWREMTSGVLQAFRTAPLWPGALAADVMLRLSSW
jgi:GT2 family glycosyltransferase